jgi:hypothetical protein
MAITPEYVQQSTRGSAVDVGDVRLACELLMKWVGAGSYVFVFDEARVREQAEMLAVRYRATGWNVVVQEQPNFFGARFHLVLQPEHTHE